MSERAHWENVHATKQDDVSWFQERPETSLTLLDAERLPSGAAVIDVGGGASRLVDHLLDAGIGDATVLDIAQAGLQQAQRRLGDRAAKVQWVVADITRWQPPRQYDAWHDRAVFHFLVDPSDRAAYRDRLQRAVKRGGRVVIGTFAADGPERCSGLPVQRYSAAALAQELGDDFRLLDNRIEEHHTPAGSVQRFQFAAFEKRL